MTARVCRRCPKFQAGSSFCSEHKKVVSQWNDWCSERVTAFDAWKLGE